MKITAITLKNVRGYQNVPYTEFSKSINVFIGSNNAGKSTILGSIFLIQNPSVLTINDITIGQEEGTIELFFEGSHLSIINNPAHNRFLFYLHNSQRNFGHVNNPSHQFSWNNSIPSEEPQNLIYPYLSKRKTVNYVDTINEANANSVSGNFTHLYSKIDRLITPQFQPGNSQYIEACDNILGFQISSLAKGGGKQAVYFVHNIEHIPLTSMGEGVANILGLITDLCIAEDRIFLIEEPENDIHPKALKALLKLIVEKSGTNQFFISTHSNIVMKYLGASTDTKIFNVTNEIGLDSSRAKLYLSKLKEVSNDPEERRQILENLGYDFFDFDLWKGWLFLEESSAEVLIRDYLIDWFVPQLKNKIRTFSAGGSGNMLTKFDDFDKLFIFLHLEPTYKNKVWVLIDAGDEEMKIIQKMKGKYSKAGWKEDSFSQLGQHDFEKYYPPIFNEKINEVLAIEDKQAKRAAKKNLLGEVILWINQDTNLAKAQFKLSVDEIIQHLKKINKALNTY